MSSGLRLPPLIRREKYSVLPPVTAGKTSCPFRYSRLPNALSNNYRNATLGGFCHSLLDEPKPFQQFLFVYFGMDFHNLNEIGFQEREDLLIVQFSLTGREMIIQAMHIVKMDSDHPIRVGVKEILVAAYPQRVR